MRGRVSGGETAFLGRGGSQHPGSQAAATRPASRGNRLLAVGISSSLAASATGVSTAPGSGV